jgi:CHAD domain-containing protein
MRDHARLQTAMLLRRLAFQVNRAGRSLEADAIHDLRVAIRRLSRCLRAFAQFYPEDAWKKPRRQMTELMRAAGRVRDRDIAISLLAEAGVPPGAAVLKRLAAARREAADEMLLELRRWKDREFSRKWRRRLDL